MLLKVNPNYAFGVLVKIIIHPYDNINHHSQHEQRILIMQKTIMIKQYEIKNKINSYPI